jgi:hypothetical protein
MSMAFSSFWGFSYVLFSWWQQVVVTAWSPKAALSLSYNETFLLQFFSFFVLSLMESYRP